MEEEVEKLKNQVKYYKDGNNSFKRQNTILYDENQSLEWEVKYLKIAVLIETPIIIAIISSVITMLLLRK